MVLQRGHVSLVDVPCVAAELVLQITYPEIVSNRQTGIHTENLDVYGVIRQHPVDDGNDVVNVVEVSNKKNDVVAFRVLVLNRGSSKLCHHLGSTFNNVFR